MTFDLRFTLHKLSVFCQVVEFGAVGRAAEALYVAQPVVTAHIRSLEERLGTVLFERSGRQTRLTPAGEAVYAWARETLTRAHELERELDGLVDGTTGAAAIAASMSLGSYMLPAILGDFRRERPLAAISLLVNSSERSIEETAAGGADFAIVNADLPPDAAMFDSEMLGREGLMLVVAPDSDLAGRKLTREDLSKVPYVARHAPHRQGLAESEIQRVGLKNLNVVMEFGHPEAMKRAVRHGLGATLLFRSAVREELAAGTLREVGLVGMDLSMPVYLVQRRRKRLSMLQQHLLGFVCERVCRELGTSPPLQILRAVAS